MLDLQESGVFENIAAPYFDSSRCAYLEEYDDARASSQNLTLVDMAGVFMILGVFVLVSLVMWTFRRSPPAKRRWSAFEEGQTKRRVIKKVCIYYIYTWVQCISSTAVYMPYSCSYT